MNQPIESFKDQYAFLSNFYPVEIEYQGIEFPSVEHAFQAAKSMSLAERRLFLGITAGAAKRLGRTVKLRDDWDIAKVYVMRELLFLKFQQIGFKELLLSTGDALLVERNDWGDTYWGICNGSGQNTLGKLLMELRSIFALDTSK